MNVRLIIFISGLTLFLLWGLVSPFVKKPLGAPRLLTNFTLGAIGSIIATLLFPGGLYLLALSLEEKGFGLLNQIRIHPIAGLVVTMVFMDLAIYAQHVLSHKLPFLWRFHKVHHGDKEFDATTALRFHPGEILYSFIYKAVLVVLLGLDKNGLILFEILLNFSAMFNHGNFQLPSTIERSLRKVIVTPDFHRVHHSPTKSMTNSNYGFFFSFWDGLFKTLNKEHSNAESFGLDDEIQSSSRNLWHLLRAPFVNR